MRIIIVEGGKRPYEAELEHDLKSMRRCVGGDIQAVYPYDDAVALICGEEAKLEGKPLNRALRDEEGEIYDIIAGTFFVCGAPPDSESFTSLTDEQVDYWLKRFAKPEFFVNINGQFICIPGEEPCQ